MAEQIPADKLVKGKWYVGRGRNGNVGYWDGARLLVIAEKFDEYVIKREPYYTEEQGCFQPFAMVDEGEMIEPFGRVGWDAHYGRRIEFRAHEIGDPPAHLADDQLVGTWKASCYSHDGRRIELTLDLQPDGVFAFRSSAEPAGPAGMSHRSGKWEVRAKERLLELRVESGTQGNSTEWHHILHYAEVTLLLHWLAFASRNAPVLYYRVSSSGPHTS